jgi:hypothetical protein
MEFAEARAQITLNPAIIETAPEARLKFPLQDIHATILAGSGGRHRLPALTLCTTLRRAEGQRRGRSDFAYCFASQIGGVTIVNG